MDPSDSYKLMRIWRCKHCTNSFYDELMIHLTCFKNLKQNYSSKNGFTCKEFNKREKL